MSTRQKIMAFISSHGVRLLWAALLATAITALAGGLAYQLSREYYTIAPYHHDSASYRLHAYQIYMAVQRSGQWSVALDTLRYKDSLDLTLRVLFAPQLLTLAHGHLPILLAFMALFLALLIYYIVKHTASWLLGIGVAMLMFSLPFIYHPFKGIADYWMDNIATWMLAAAVLCWLLGDQLRHKRWGLACSLLLVGTLAERSLIAVYAAPLFVVPFVIALIQIIRQGGLRLAVKSVAVFVLPALLFGAVITALRWQELYWYYFVSGYDYGTRADTLLRILNQISTDSGISLVIFAITALVFVVLARKNRQSDTALLTLLWLLIALPMEIVIIGQFYHSFFVLWSPLLLVLLAVLAGRLPIPIARSAEGKPPARCIQQPLSAWILAAQTTLRANSGIALIVIAIGAALLTYSSVTAQAHTLAAQKGYTGQTYRAIAHTIAFAPPGTSVALLFNQTYEPLMNHVIFDFGHSPVRALQVNTHDQYYIAGYGSAATADEITRVFIDRLDGGEATLAFAFANPDSVDDLPLLVGANNPLSRQIIVALSQYMRNSSYWKAIERIPSPYGSIYVYSYSEQPLSTVEKWQSLQAYALSREMPLLMAPDTQTRVLDYRSHYAPEVVSGRRVQWLPAGEHGLKFSLFTDQPRQVLLNMRVSPGPSRPDPLRTLTLTGTNPPQVITISQTQNMTFTINLLAGLTDISFSVAETATLPRASARDARELMMMLVDPILLPVKP